MENGIGGMVAMEGAKIRRLTSSVSYVIGRRVHAQCSRDCAAVVCSTSLSVYAVDSRLGRTKIGIHDFPSSRSTVR